MKSNAIRTIAVVGAGTMGRGIAQVFATSGFEVLLFDSQPGLSESALLAISENLSTLVSKGRINARQAHDAAAAIHRANSIDELKADMIVEAVVEKLDVKKALFAALEQVNSEGCLFATNTSSIPIAQIAGSLKHPERLAGLHFFNPAPVMKLVEIVKGAVTAPEVVESLFAVTRKLGKEAVLAQDSPGFIVNRVARHYYVESLKVLEESVASHETIDALLRSVGFKMGPFELMDLIGVDVNFSVTCSMYNSFHQLSRFRPSRVQQQKVDAGHHGRKSGKGFYDYS